MAELKQVGEYQDLDLIILPFLLEKKVLSLLCRQGGLIAPPRMEGMYLGPVLIIRIPKEELQHISKGYFLLKRVGNETRGKLDSQMLKVPGPGAYTPGDRTISYRLVSPGWG